MALTWVAKPTPEYVVPAPDGTSLDLGDRVTWTEVKHGRWSECIAYALTRPKGTLLNFAIPGASASDWVVSGTRCDREKPDRGTVTVTWTSLTFSTPPPGEFSVIPLELNPAITSHSTFASLTDAERDQAEACRRAGTWELRGKLQSKINAGASSTLINKLLAKWKRGMETYYIAGLKYQITTYYYSSPGCTRGGFRQSPSTPITGWTWPSGMSWLRLSDDLSYSQGLYKLTNTWLGGPSGHWDTDIYP
jgi:hypothetical protein